MRRLDLVGVGVPTHHKVEVVLPQDIDHIRQKLVRSGLQFRRAAIEQGRAQRHREFAVTLRGQHAETAAVPAIALFVVGIQPGLGGCGGKAADGRCRVQDAQQVEEGGFTQGLGADAAAPVAKLAGGVFFQIAHFRCCGAAGGEGFANGAHDERLLVAVLALGQRQGAGPGGAGQRIDANPPPLLAD